LRSLYSQTDYYPFKILSINQDEKTNSTYYLLKDYFGIKHRYYPTPTEQARELNDVFSLWVEGIDPGEGNKSHLKFNLESPSEKQVEVVHQISLPTDSPDDEIQVDPRKHSKYGYEDHQKEFKSSLVFPAGGIQPDIDKQVLIISKTIAGFQNAEGGTLYLGVDDSGNVCGINEDYKYLNSSTIDTNTYQTNTDGYENKIRSSIRHLLGSLANANLRIEFDTSDNRSICIVHIAASDRPVFMQGSKLFQRAGNMTQLLKDDEITYFVERKLLTRGNNQIQVALRRGSDLVVEDVIPVAPKNDEHPEINPTSEITALEKTPIDYNNIIFYLNLYKNGNWSFSPNHQMETDSLLVLPIPKIVKREMLVLVYSTGRVNIISIQDLFWPKGVDRKRKKRNFNHRYLTGWNSEVDLINVFVAKKTDLLVFKSMTEDNKEWIKLHRIEDLQVYNINALGNILVNPRLSGARLQSCNRIPQEFAFHLGGLILPSNQTSTSLGYAANDQGLKVKINLLNKVLEVVTRR
jgi:hypothetical protein